MEESGGRQRAKNDLLIRGGTPVFQAMLRFAQQCFYGVKGRGGRKMSGKNFNLMLRRLFRRYIVNRSEADQSNVKSKQGIILWIQLYPIIPRHFNLHLKKIDIAQVQPFNSNQTIRVLSRRLYSFLFFVRNFPCELIARFQDGKDNQSTGRVRDAIINQPRSANTRNFEYP